MKLVWLLCVVVQAFLLPPRPVHLQNRSRLDLSAGVVHQCGIMSEVMKRLGSALVPRVMREHAVEGVLRELDHAIGDLLPVLRTCSLFCGLSDDELDALVRCMTPTLRKAGDTVMQEGARARRLMLLLNGAAEILVTRGDQPVKLATVAWQTVLGEECLVGERVYRATARLTADAVLLTLSLRGFGRFAAARLVSGVTTAEAHEDISRGAQWLAIRHAPEAGGRMPDDAKGVALSELRTFITARAPDSLQICTAARPTDAALAAYLLRLWGCRANYLKERRLATGSGPS